MIDHVLRLIIAYIYITKNFLDFERYISETRVYPVTFHQNVYKFKNLF